jgi:hypothetical protein
VQSLPGSLPGESPDQMDVFMGKTQSNMATYGTIDGNII